MAMAEPFQCAAETTDPRILRSRRMLMESLARLLQEGVRRNIRPGHHRRGNAELGHLLPPLSGQERVAAGHDRRFRELIERRGISFTDCNAALVLLRLAFATISLRPQAAPLSWLGYRSKVPSSRSLRACSRKAFRVMRWPPVSTRHCWRLRRPGPSSEPRAAGFRPPTASPLRKWPLGLKRW